MQTTSPYKTAEQLKIQPWERDGLIALVGPLSRGELPGFDMGHWEAAVGDYGCGTVRCIGGWVDHAAGRKTQTSHQWPQSLRDLYFPSVAEAWWATQPQAARAVLSFLTTGYPRWDDVMREAA